MKWRPVHCALYRNKEVDRLTQLVACQSQPALLISFSNTKRIVCSCIIKRAVKASIIYWGHKNWVAWQDPKKSPAITSTSTVAVICFRLTTGHNYFWHKE